MDEGLYYAERKGVVKEEQIDLNIFKKLFLNFYESLKENLYFLESTGYYCVDSGKYSGKWGYDVETFIYLKTKLRNIWPIKEHIEYYNESTLFTIIEFLYDYVSEPIDKWYYSWGKCGWHCTKYNKESG